MPTGVHIGHVEEIANSLLDSGLGVALTNLRAISLACETPGLCPDELGSLRRMGQEALEAMMPKKMEHPVDPFPIF